MKLSRTRRLYKVYGIGENQVYALRDVLFSIGKGESVAIIGQSGSGKSILLHMIGDVDVPSSDHAWVDGNDVCARNRGELAVFRRRQVGLTYQSYNLIPVLNVMDNMTLSVKPDGQKVNQERLEELLDVLDSRDRAAHLLRQLSGEQQQGAAVGRALLYTPVLVLADEPTRDLNSRNSQEITSLPRHSDRTYRQTLILITHDREIAFQADHIIRLKDGCIISDASNGRQEGRI